MRSDTNRASFCRYDRRTDVRCKDEHIRLDEGETLTIVAFNLSEETSKSVNMRWSGYKDKKEEDLQSEGVVQHTLFRTNFRRDDAEEIEWSSGNADVDIANGQFAPPVRYKYSTWPHGKISGPGEFSCETKGPPPFDSYVEPPPPPLKPDDYYSDP